MRNLWEFLWANKEWLFSGAGIAATTAVLGALAWFLRNIRRDASTPDVSEPSPSIGSGTHHAYLPRGYDRAPRLEFADGIVAGIAVTTELELKELFALLKRFKSWEELLAHFTPKVHDRMAQIMELHTYADAKRLRPEFESQLADEFSPQFAEYGVRLKRIGIGRFIRYN